MSLQGRGGVVVLHVRGRWWGKGKGWWGKYCRLHLLTQPRVPQAALTVKHVRNSPCHVGQQFWMTSHEGKMNNKKQHLFFQGRIIFQSFPESKLSPTVPSLGSGSRIFSSSLAWNFNSEQLNSAECRLPAWVAVLANSVSALNASIDVSAVVERLTAGTVPWRSSLSGGAAEVCGGRHNRLESGVTL